MTGLGPSRFQNHPIRLQASPLPQTGHPCWPEEQGHRAWHGWLRGQGGSVLQQLWEDGVTGAGLGWTHLTLPPLDTCCGDNLHQPWARRSVEHLPAARPAALEGALQNLPWGAWGQTMSCLLGPRVQQREEVQGLHPMQHPVCRAVRQRYVPRVHPLDTPPTQWPRWTSELCL